MSSDQNAKFDSPEEQRNLVFETVQDSSSLADETDLPRFSSASEAPSSETVSKEKPVADVDPTAENSNNSTSFGSVPPKTGNVPPSGSVPPGYPPYSCGNYPPPPPWYVPAQHRSNGCGSFLLKLFFGLFGIVAALGVLLFICAACLTGLVQAVSQIDSHPMPIAEKTLSGSVLSMNKIVILPIEGVIEGKEDGFIRKAIRQAKEDVRVVGIVLRINSPGGTMSGSDYYHYLLKDLKTEKNIPIVVSMGSMAASGGYYISTIGNKIFAEPSTLTGSIGVIIPLYNAADLCKKIGVCSTAVTSGPMKGMGDFTKPMGSDEKEIWQNLVNTSYEQFLKVIKEGRPAFASQVAKQKTDSDKTVSKDDAQKADAKDAKADPMKKSQSDKSDAALRKIADGRIYTANDALKLGLIDEIGFLDAAVRETIKLAKVNELDTQVVRYRNPTGLAALLSESESAARAANVAQLAADMSTPGVWCICPRLIPIKNEK